MVERLSMETKATPRAVPGTELCLGQLEGHSAALLPCGLWYRKTISVANRPSQFVTDLFSVHARRARWTAWCLGM